MRNDLREALREYRWDLVATVITLVILGPTVHHLSDLTWSQAVGVVVVPIVMMLGLKLAIEGWFGRNELDSNDAELVDVHVDRRGHLHGSWRRRPQEPPFPSGT